MRKCRIVRDDKDTNNLYNWFLSYPPFPKSSHIMSLSTGVIGDNSINCFKASEIGIYPLHRIIGKRFEEINLKRSHRVLPLSAVHSSIKIKNRIIPIDPHLLFQRISVLKKN